MLALPQDVLLLIVTRLPYRGMLSLSYVCSSYRSLFAAELPWQTNLLARYNVYASGSSRQLCKRTIRGSQATPFSSMRHVVAMDCAGSCTLITTVAGECWIAMCGREKRIPIGRAVDALLCVGEEISVAVLTTYNLCFVMALDNDLEYKEEIDLVMSRAIHHYSCGRAGCRLVYTRLYSHRQ
jgi:hypothetical protein